MNSSIRLYTHIEPEIISYCFIQVAVFSNEFLLHKPNVCIAHFFHINNETSILPGHT